MMNGKKESIIFLAISILFSSMLIPFVSDDGNGLKEYDESDNDCRILNSFRHVSDKTIGDINGDGIIDFTLMDSSRNYYILSGERTTNSDNIDILSDYEFKIQVNNSDLILSIKEIVDIDGNKYEDMIFHEKTTYGDDRDYGRIRILNGREFSRFPDTIYIEDDGSSSYWNMSIFGDNSSVGFGYETLVFDYNNDRMNDIIISDPYIDISKEEYGDLYFFDGKIIKNRTLNLTQVSFIMEGKYMGSSIGFGNNLFYTDFNNDSYLDIGWSYRYLNYKGMQDCGLTVIIFNQGYIPTGNISIDDFNTTYIYGNNENDGAGMNDGLRLAKGDFNSDGIDDLVIGAPGIDDPYMNQGKIYVVPGSEEIRPEIRLVKSNCLFYITGWGGYELSEGIDVGDYNNDSYPDIIFSSGVSKNGRGSGAAFIWYGREIEQNVYDQEEYSEAYYGIGVVDFERYGYFNFFNDIDKDGFLDIVIMPFEGTYLDIFFNRNDPPDISDITIWDPNPYRNDLNYLSFHCRDDRTPNHDLDVEAEVSTDGSIWDPLPLEIYYSNNHTYVYNITAGKYDPIGSYSYRIRSVDSEGSSAGWVYLNDSVEIVNADPQILAVNVSSDVVEYNETLWIDVYPYDREDDIEDMSVAADLRVGEDIVVTSDKVKVVEDHFNISFNISFDIPDGEYQLFIIVWDSNGGMNSSYLSDNISIPDVPTEVHDIWFGPDSILRGERFRYSFNVTDLNDDLAVIDPTVNLVNVSNGISKELSFDILGGGHKLEIIGGYRFDYSDSLGFYNLEITFGDIFLAFTNVVEVRNNKVVIPKNEFELYINSSGFESVDLMDLAYDPEQENLLNWSIEDTDFTDGIDASLDDYVLKVETVDNVTYNGSVVLNVSDMDGSFGFITYYIHVNTTVYVPPVIIDYDVEFELDHPDTSDQYEVTVSVHFRFVNKGNTNLTVNMKPVGDGSAYIHFLDDTNTVNFGEDLEIDDSFKMTLIEGTNSYSIGLEVTVLGETRTLWDNVSILYEKEEVEPVDDDDDEGPGAILYIGIGIGALVLIAVVILIVFMVSRKKKEPEGSFGSEGSDGSVEERIGIDSTSVVGPEGSSNNGYEE